MEDFTKKSAYHSDQDNVPWCRSTKIILKTYRRSVVVCAAWRLTRQRYDRYTVFFKSVAAGYVQDQTTKKYSRKSKHPNSNLAMPPNKSPAGLGGWLEHVYVSEEFRLRTGVFLTVAEPTSLAGRRKNVVSFNFGGNRRKSGWTSQNV
jgi:hypothetical protein